MIVGSNVIWEIVRLKFFHSSESVSVTEGLLQFKVLNSFTKIRCQNFSFQKSGQDCILHLYSIKVKVLETGSQIGKENIFVGGTSTKPWVFFPFGGQNIYPECTEKIQCIHEFREDDNKLVLKKSKPIMITKRTLESDITNIFLGFNAPISDNVSVFYQQESSLLRMNVMM